MCSICREKDEFNELLHRFDFLDSVDWLGIRANMRKLHSKKTSGKTLDGANVFLGNCSPRFAHAAGLVGRSEEEGEERQTS